MGTELPDYYFRVRENGAAVFRVDTENRQRRIEMDQIAVVNVVNGQIKPHGQRPLAPDEIAAIEDWMARHGIGTPDVTLPSLDAALSQLRLPAA